MDGLSPAEYGVTAALLLGMGGLVLLVPHPPSPWKSEALLDRASIRLLTPDDESLRTTLSDASDWFANAPTAFPVFDLALGAVLQGDLDQLQELAAIDLEAAAVAGALLVLNKRLVGRVRPGIDPCDGLDDFDCRSDASKRSFVSGHTVASFTGAGLTCAYHAALSPYGGGVGDATPCALSLASALVAGVLRVASDQHYASDVLAGALIGLGSGFLLPYLLHYQREPEVELASAVPRRAVQIWFAGGALGGGDKVRPAAALELGVVDHFRRQGVGVSLGADARVARRNDRDERREVVGRLALAYDWVGLGGLGRYRSTRIAERDGHALDGGPFLEIGAPRGDREAALLFAWLPLADGSAQSFLARVELGLGEWLFLRAEVDTALDPNGAPSPTTWLGLGGRLPL